MKMRNDGGGPGYERTGAWRPERENARAERPGRENMRSGRSECENTRSGKPERGNMSPGRSDRENTRSGKREDGNMRPGRPERENTKVGRLERENTRAGRPERENTRISRPEHKRADVVKSGFERSERGGLERKKAEAVRPEHGKLRAGSPDRKRTENDRFDRNRIPVVRPVPPAQVCPAAKKCGGCQYIEIPYSEQLRKKQSRMQTLFGSFCRVYPIVGMEHPLYYRNKVHAVFGHRKGQIISGIYEENTHHIVPIDRCMIEDQKSDEIIVTIRELLKSFKIRTYDEDTGYGLLRHVLVRRAFATGEIMVVLVTRSPVFPSRNHFVEALRARHPEITTIIQNMNDRDTSMVLGDREHILYGRGYIEDILCGCRFRISAKSFYQVNPILAERLYTKALELAGLTGRETVLDAYCGIGTIGIIAARRARQVYGVELNPDAVGDAICNAKLNGIRNIRFYQNDATRFMTQMAQSGDTVDVVLMDPPRSGSTEEFIHAVKAVQAKKVVYISCGPDTLARDLQIFGKVGYQAKGVWPYDMFPVTGHCECVTLMIRKDK